MTPATLSMEPERRITLCRAWVAAIRDQHHLHEQTTRELASAMIQLLNTYDVQKLPPLRAALWKSLMLLADEIAKTGVRVPPMQ